MKKLFCSALLACSLQAAHAQTTTSPVPHATASKDDDAILVELTGTPEAGWRKLAQVLGERGYSIEHSDKDLLTLSTHTFGSTDFPFRLTGMVVNQHLILRLYAGGTTPVLGLPTILVRRRNGDSRHWRELEAIAKEIGGSIRYKTSVAGILN